MVKHYGTKALEPSSGEYIMNKTHHFIFSGSLLLLVMASPALATPTSEPVKIGDVIYFQYGDHGNNGGGEFNVYSQAGTFLYQSFCLEYNEHIYLGRNYTYEVKDISTAAKSGVFGEVSEKADPISEYTAYLYHNFYWGSLDGYTYVGGKESAKDLQEAIWFFEDEWVDSLKIGEGFSNQFTTLAYNAVDSGSWSGLGDVRVMNLGKYQDQLTVAPVPEPATMLLFGTGLIGLAGIARRRNS